MLNRKEVMVSVICLTYNHEKYIRQCLEGFVRQETNFNFEVFVHDDASTDSTPEIIKEYAQKYPEIIKPIYQKINQYSQKIPIYKTFIEPFVRGQYLAYCEGDDYWCDPKKLQKQVNAMESHPECTICTCRVRFMKEDGTLLDEYRPELSHPIKEGIQDSSWLISRIPEYTFQTASFLLKKETKEYCEKNYPELFAATRVSKTLFLSLISVGKCYYISDAMACYRVNSVGSWTQSQKNIQNRVKHYSAISQFYKTYDSYLKQNYREYDKLDLKGMYQTIDYNDVYVAAYTQQVGLLCSKRYREILKQNFTWKNSLLLYIVACFPRLGMWLSHKVP